MLAVATVLVAGAAAAEPVAVVVHTGADTPVTPQQAASAVDRAARASGDTAVLDAFDRARARLDQNAVPAARLAGFRHAQALARAGWRAYLAVEPRAAVESLTRAREAVLAVLDLQGAIELHADLSLRLGVVLHQLGHADQATEALRLAAALDPGRVVSLAEFSPDAVAAYEAARQASAPDAAVRIETEPAGAHIELDGRPAGLSPVVVIVPAGAHAVVARAPGYRARGRIVPVGAGQGRVTLALERDAAAAAVVRGPDALAAGRLPDDTAIAVQGLVTYAGVEAVVLVASVWRRGAPALLGQRCAPRGAAVRCTRVVEIGYDSAARVDTAAALLWETLRHEPRHQRPALLADARLTRAETRPRARAPVARRCSWCRSPWLWVGAGAAAAIAGTMWALSRDQAITPVVTVEPCMFGGCAP